VALEDAIFLARSCKKVYLIHRRDALRGAKILQNKLMAMDNVEILWDTVVEEIFGRRDCGWNPGAKQKDRTEPGD